MLAFKLKIVKITNTIVNQKIAQPIVSFDKCKLFLYCEDKQIGNCNFVVKHSV